jgi:hypothetical protein
MNGRITILLSAFFLAIFITACSGYFNNDASKDVDGGMNKLALSGGGYLSTDQYNEITPFLYRDASSGKTWLFFSSDRGGNYDIYYAEMDSEGRFTLLKMMDTNINSSSNEIASVVFKAVSAGAPITNLYISFIRYSSLGSTNILTYSLDSNFNTLSFIPPNIITNATSLGMMDNFLLIMCGNNFILKYMNVATGGFQWGAYSSINVGSGIDSANGYKDGLFEFYILCRANNRFSGLSYFPQTNGIKPFNVDSYASESMDKYPYIDFSGNYKVYFASDRYGKGNFDLYRYNTLTFDKVVK